MKTKTPPIEKQLAAAEEVAKKANAKVLELQNKLQAQQKAQEPKSICDKINGWQDVYKHLKVNPKKDVVKVDGFDKGQTQYLHHVIAHMRLCETYNGKKKLNTSDKRWYNWYRLASGSGLVFDSSHYYNVNAFVSSSSRLSFCEEEYLNDVRTKFGSDKKLIDLE